MLTEERKAYMREYMRTKYKDKRDEYVKNWLKRNRKKYLEYLKKYYQEHK